jgi:hypothetical protein
MIATDMYTYILLYGGRGHVYDSMIDTDMYINNSMMAKDMYMTL